MRIVHHLIIWITNPDSIASPHTKKSIISWTGRLNYNNGNKLRHIFFSILFHFFVDLYDILFSFGGIASAVANVFPLHFFSKFEG